MSRKAAISGARTGGAKCVIAVPAGEAPWPLEGDRREAVLRDLAEIVAGLEGRYLTGPDVGTTPADMAFVHTLTEFAAGFREGGGRRRSAPPPASTPACAPPPATCSARRSSPAAA